MADVRAAVTDTHALVFHVGGRWDAKGAKARALFEACENREALIYVPAAVIWECGLLARGSSSRVAPRASIRSTLYFPASTYHSEIISSS